jgi:hypothetical protein
LLEQCALRGAAFSNPSTVFSYRLNVEENRSGVFEHYMDGLRERHEGIARACLECPGGVVQYADIRRFYPSITTELAARSWRERCEAARLPERFHQVGQKLIEDYRKAAGEEALGVLTGPMFSHLIGNLVLRRVDDELSASLPARYFRYVDDIILVGEPSAVSQSMDILRGRLGDEGFKLHDDLSPKSLRVSASDWLAGRHDFSQGRGVDSWPRLIGDLKRFLLLDPNRGEALQVALRSESFRIPVLDYSTVVRERSFRESAHRYTPGHWFRSRRRASDLTVEALLQLARVLRGKYEAEFHNLLEGAAELSGYERKRRIPKLRYRAGRLIYLATDDSLSRLALEARGIPELHLHVQVMEGVATGKIDNLLSLGNNAAQAAAQPLLAAGKPCSLAREPQNDFENHGLAVFLLNGVPVMRPSPLSPAQPEIVRFAASGSDISLMRSTDPYVREIACLHGLSEGPRHAETLRAAFDEDEELVMDAVDQIQQSASS